MSDGYTTARTGASHATKAYRQGYSAGKRSTSGVEREPLARWRKNNVGTVLGAFEANWLQGFNDGCVEGGTR